MSGSSHRSGSGTLRRSSARRTLAAALITGRRSMIRTDGLEGAVLGGGRTHPRHTVPCRDALRDTAGNSGGALTGSDRCLLIIGDVANPIFGYATPAVGVQAASGDGYRVSAQDYRSRPDPGRM